MLNIAHRGARWLAVENTLEAIHVAFCEGADAVEIDVQLTSDHELVVFHDADLRNWTGASQRIIQTPWRDLRDISLLDERGHRGKIAHLDEVLERWPHGPGFFNFELKVDTTVASAPERLAELVAQRLPTPCNAVISSFSRDSLRRFARSRPDISLAALIHETDDWPYSVLWQVDTRRYDEELGAIQAELGERFDAVHPHGRVMSPERLAAWREVGLAVRPWVINEPQHWEMCLAVGVEAAITDDPGGLSAWLKRQ